MTIDSIEFAKNLIDWIFVNHEHDLNEVKMEGRPFVDSLELETFIKKQCPEVATYYYNKRDGDGDDFENRDEIMGINEQDPYDESRMAEE